MTKPDGVLFQFNSDRRRLRFYWFIYLLIGLSSGAMVGWRDGGASCEDGLLCYTLWFWYPSPPMSTPGLGTGTPLLTILSVLVVFSSASVNSIDAVALSVRWGCARTPPPKKKEGESSSVCVASSVGRV